MITRLIWTIWTPMSSVSKKDDKLNLSFSLSNNVDQYVWCITRCHSVKTLKYLTEFLCKLYMWPLLWIAIRNSCSTSAMWCRHPAPPFHCRRAWSSRWSVRPRPMLTLTLWAPVGWTRPVCTGHTTIWSRTGRVQGAVAVYLVKYVSYLSSILRWPK